MVRKLLIWGIVLFIAFFWFATVFKTCGNKAVETAGDVTSGISSTTKGALDGAKDLAGDAVDGAKDLAGDAVDGVKNAGKKAGEFLDDEDDDSYDIDDENDRSEDNEDEGYGYDDEDEETIVNKNDGKDEDDDDEEEEEEEEDNEEEASSSRSSSSSSSNAGSADGKYLVVTGSFSDEVNAERMVSKLKKMGFPNAEVFSFDFSEYFSVTAGRYSSSEESRNAANSLEAQGIDAYAHKMRSKYFK